MGHRLLTVPSRRCCQVHPFYPQPAGCCSLWLWRCQGRLLQDSEGYVATVSGTIHPHDNLGRGTMTTGELTRNQLQRSRSRRIFSVLVPSPEPSPPISSRLPVLSVWRFSERWRVLIFSTCVLLTPAVWAQWRTPSWFDLPARSSLPVAPVSLLTLTPFNGSAYVPQPGQMEHS